MQAIVVMTWSGGQKWAEHCLKSLKALEYSEYPIIVTINDALHVDKAWLKSLQDRYTVIPIEYDGYEVGAIKAVYESLPEVEEFWTFQDSVYIKSPAFILESFTKHKGISVSYSQQYPYECYLGKWLRSGLDLIEIPEVSSKKEAMLYEWKLAKTYLDPVQKYVGIDPEWSTTSARNSIEDVMGEERFLQDGIHLVKYKSTTRESGNIPDSWSEETYQTFLKSWRQNGRNLHGRYV